LAHLTPSLLWKKHRFKQFSCGFSNLILLEPAKNALSGSLSRRDREFQRVYSSVVDKTACHNVAQEGVEVSCALCETRKEKRFCPAIHGHICAQCCGEQREVTLDCPSSCVYLQQSRQHEKPRRAGEVSGEALFENVEIGQQFLYEHEHLILGLSFSLSRAARADRDLTDIDLIGAISAVAKFYETLVHSGLHYETPLPALRQQAVAAELQKMVREYRETEQKHMGYMRLRDAEILRALVFLVRMAYTRTSGRPKSRAFVDFLMQQFPPQESAIVDAAKSGGSLILP